MSASSGGAVPVRQLIVFPAAVTLAVTILRVLGEVNDWSSTLFGKAAGGGGSVVGIAWLVPVFGVYFALKLAGIGLAPAGMGRAIGLAFAALLVVPASGLFANGLKLGPLGQLSTFCTGSVVAVWIGHRAWPALGTTLLAYGVAARIPVIVVMLIAMLGQWGTHYDVAPPNFPEVDTWNLWAKWLAIGVLPQLTIWMAFTVVLGALFGSIAAAVTRLARPATA